VYDGKEVNIEARLVNYMMDSTRRCLYNKLMIRPLSFHHCCVAVAEFSTAML